MRLSGRLTVAFVVLSAASMLFYPGGSTFIPDAKGFSWLNNFFSDLGTSKGYGSSVPMAVNQLFYLAILAAAVAIVSFFREQKAGKLTKVLSWLASISLVLLLFLPADRYLWPHRITAVAIVAFLTLACWAFYAELAASKAKSITLACSVVLSAYLGWLLLGPLPDASLMANTIHAISQKIAVYAFILLVLCFNAFELKDKTQEKAA